LYVSANNTAWDLIKSELDVLQSLNKSLTQNTKNLTAERDLCRRSECTLGNIIADAMVAALNGDSIWSDDATRIGIFPAVHLQPNTTIPEGTYARAECFVL
jgi:2',3'-cyclic-nucleotide 2'-phosphodiesterase (5'-nucleotidase family)